MVRLWEDPGVQDTVPLKEWIPKNPEVKMPCTEEVVLDDAQWKEAKFPSFPVPEEVLTHVSIDAWVARIASMKASEHLLAYVPLMEEVLHDLSEGCDSKVRSPGTSATRSRNHFPCPEIDIPRIADALASEVKAGHMAGPLDVGQVTNAKVNGFVSIVKPDGSRRQVGNLAHPPGLSFNDNIDPKVLDTWSVKQTTARQFADMIMRAGPNAIISCSDMVAAYKNLPVMKEQRRLQVFEFCGKQFVDLMLIFGDKCACMWYDRFHHCIVWYFVWPEVKIPLTWVGRTIDDLSTVSPQGAENYTKSFVQKYREKLALLNIGAAPHDPLLRKAFDGSRVGEVLGVRFNTVNMTWQIPHPKLLGFVQLLSSAMEGSRLSLHEAEVLHGKLSNIAQLAPPLNLLIAEVLSFLTDLLAKFNEEKLKSRSSKSYAVPEAMVHDLRSVRALLLHSEEFPLPLVELEPSPMLGAVEVWSDASGHIISSPSLGVYVPATGCDNPLVASLAFPRCFLQAQDSMGKKSYCKTTTLESLAYLAVLCLDPMRFVERDVLFHIDNVASVVALSKGRSRDPWASTLIRATRVVAAALGCSVFAEWERRRSSSCSEIADDLTHNLVGKLSDRELEAYVRGSFLQFPLPILEWMADPKPDSALGRKCVIWLRRQFPELSFLKPLLF